MDNAFTFASWRVSLTISFNDSAARRGCSPLRACWCPCARNSLLSDNSSNLSSLVLPATAKSGSERSLASSIGGTLRSGKECILKNKKSS